MRLSPGHRHRVYAISSTVNAIINLKNVGYLTLDESGSLIDSPVWHSGTYGRADWDRDRVLHTQNILICARHEKDQKVHLNICKIENSATFLFETKMRKMLGENGQGFTFFSCVAYS